MWSLTFRRIFFKEFRACHFPFCAPSSAYYSEMTDVSSSSSSSRALKSIIFDKIRLNGPITVAEYMRLSSSVYYSLPATSTKGAAVAGIGDDFITSPEISQMFGELIGVWCTYEMQKIGHRGPWQVVELGPGNGSLMADFLKTLQRLRLIGDDDEHQLSVHMVELSDALAAKQEHLLCSHRGASEQKSLDQEGSLSGRLEVPYKQNVSNFGPSIRWHRDVENVPRQFSVILAHEFFDALPVHKFQRTSSGKWREVYIDADISRNCLRFVLARTESFAQRIYLNNDVLERLSPDADHIEISPQSLYILQKIMDRITEDGGVALIVDYGYDHDKGGDTLRGFRKHRIIENFIDEEPGSYDITADVNFGHLKRVAEKKVCCFGPIPQGQFLKNLGIEFRFKRLLENAKSEEQRTYLRRSYEMLVDEDKMGSRFKVMALFPKVLKPYLALRPPVGFVAPG